jgi:hypothetical protein
MLGSENRLAKTTDDKIVAQRVTPDFIPDVPKRCAVWQRGFRHGVAPGLLPILSIPRASETEH